MKIGFIGLGIMGSRMAANLQKQGYPLVVFNRTRTKAQPLLDKGACFAESPVKLAEQVDLLFTMLAHPDAVEQAALGRNGFLSHLKPNTLWIDCSSVNPSFSKKMAAAAAARQIRFVDAPVTGSAPVAAEAKLIFWVGADMADLERIRPLLLWRTWGRDLHENGDQSFIRHWNGRVRRSDGAGRRARALAKDVVRFIARHARGRAVFGGEAGQDRQG